jgi:hypothetical protein
MVHIPPYRTVIISEDKAAFRSDIRARFGLGGVAAGSMPSSAKDDATFKAMECSSAWAHQDKTAIRIVQQMATTTNHAPKRADFESVAGVTVAK